MDNCDLEKLSVSAGNLQPAFTPEVTDYKMTVESNINKVIVDLITSDCGASYSIVSTALQINVTKYRVSFYLALTQKLTSSASCVFLYFSFLVTAPAPLN